MLTIHANLKQSDHCLTHSCQQPRLQHSYILQSSDTSFTFRPLWSQLNFSNCPQSGAVSHMNMNSSPSLVHTNSSFPLNISGRQLKPNVHGIPQKVYENFRRGQEYCVVARTLYNSSPDLETLACFFL